MPNDPPLPVSQSPRHTGKTFRASLWIIAGLAFAQIAAIAFAVVRHDIGNRDLSERRPLAKPPTLTTSTTVPKGFPPLTRMFAEGTTPAEPPPVLEPTTEHTILDPLVRDMVEVGRLMREEGDVQSALEQFRRADQQIPGNPEILYELATCYDTLDLQDEASDARLAIRNLGPERGGIFYKLAELSLLGSEDGGAARRSLVSFGNTRLYQHPQETSGEMVTLRASVKAAPGAEIDPDRIYLRVLFFDLVDGRSIARGLHEGEYPQHLVTEPIDWKDNPPEEIIDFIYFRPNSQDQQSARPRKFYGFVAQLFYDDEWQDLVAQPRTLIEEMRSAEDATTSPELLDPDGSRVENSLFPKP